MSDLVKPLLKPRPGPAFARLNRWTKMMLVSVSCTILAGFLPGGALYIRMLVEAGVCSSVCKTFELKDDGTCNAQYALVSRAFTSGMALISLALLPVGIAFDFYGGRALGYKGGLVATLGTLSLIGIIEASKHGFDAWTPEALFVVVAIIDAGSVANSYALMSLMWEFVDYQVLVFSLMVGTYSLGAFIPNLVQSFMSLTSYSLSSALAVVVFVESMCCVFCYILVPTQEEYYSMARHALGMPLPKPKSGRICATLKKACTVLRVHWPTHIQLVFANGFTYAAITMYSSLAGEYANNLFHSTAAMNTLPSVYTMWLALVGGFGLPLLSYGFGKLDNATELFVLTTTTAAVVMAATITLPYWSAQTACCIASALYQSSLQVFSTAYVTRYASPALIATVMGLLMTYVMLAIALALVLFSVIGGMDDSTMAQSLLIVCSVGAVISCLFCLTIRREGFPDMPVLLPEDEIEIAEPFGCKTLDEVVYVLHMNSRQELLKELSSTDALALTKLLQRIDFERMENSLGIHREVESAVSSRDEDYKHEAFYPRAVEHEDKVTMQWVSEGLDRTSPVTESSQTPFSLMSLCSFTSCCMSSDHGILIDDVDADGEPIGVTSHAVLERSPTSPSKVRHFNEKLVDAVRKKDKEAVLGLYRTEDCNLLYVAYQDMLDEMMSAAEANQFENEWEQLVPEEEYQTLVAERPELKVAFMKMLAYRTKKHVFG